MKVKDLIKILKTHDPNAQVEVEMEENGDRAGVTRIDATFYNHPSNKWIVIVGDR